MVARDDDMVVFVVYVIVALAIVTVVIAGD